MQQTNTALREASHPGSRTKFRGVVRAASLVTSAVLAILILAAVVPPLTADQSDRAVVNAPIALLTAPVAGDVESISIRPGQVIGGGQTVARIVNPRVDRSTLITLEGKYAETKGRASAAANKRASNLAYLASLDKSIEQQTQQISVIFRQQITELKAALEASIASGQERKTLVDRQTSMVSRNVASPDMLKPSEQQYAAALHRRDVESAKLSQKVTQLEGLLRGVYVGEDLAGLATLAQKRRDIEFDTQRLEIEQVELETSHRDQQRLLDNERDRLVSLSGATVQAPSSGEILSIGAAAGRHVSAGDSLMTLVNCERTVIVAIFSYRQAQDLNVGTRVAISGLASSPSFGRVSEILPKTSDKVDDLYAVPFPQTERREMYVLVAPEVVPEHTRAAAGAPARGAACNVGRWVTVTRSSGWVPSMSVLWRSVQDQAGMLASSAFSAPVSGVSPASADDRTGSL